MRVVAYRGQRLLLGALVLIMVVGGALYINSRAPDRVSSNAPSSAPSDLYGKALVIIDGDSGQILIGRAAYAKLPPGPLLQMLTAVTAVEGASANAPVLISRHAASQPGVRLGLFRGVTVELGDLVRAFWFISAADAGMAMVEHVAGSDAAFVRLMQEYARRVGALETTVISALGSDHPRQLSTAYDLALIARAVLDDPLLSVIASERRGWVVWDDVRRELLHINSLLWRYPGAAGLKSGYGQDAGYVAAIAARRGGRQLIGVVLGATTEEARWHDLSTHLDFAFRHYAELLERPMTDALPYDVRPGDTLLGIAASTGVAPGLIQSWNALTDPNRLQVGMRLWLPTEPVSTTRPAL